MGERSGVVTKSQIQVGESLPSVLLCEGTPDKTVNISEFKQGKVVIFGLPGAFTPTCSSEHVPGFVKSVDAIKKKGVEAVICIATNDPFVMSAWGKNLDPEGKIRFLADPRAEFVKATGLSIDLTPVLGGIRSKRFIMVVADGKVKFISVEPDGTSLTCSRATDILKML
ncbi:hypothetical protein BsWGS_10073 [Bradybaena similaris]